MAMDSKSSALPQRKPANAGQCSAIRTYVGRLGDGITDLGGGAIASESEPVVEALGSAECPATAASQCQKLQYVGFMLGLMDMSPQTYRRPGISAFFANLESEDAGMGDKCSAESLAYSGASVRKQFPKGLVKYFCTAGSQDYLLGQQAGMLDANGNCDTSDSALERLKSLLVNQAPESIKNLPTYNARLAPIVTRIYRLKNQAPSDEDAFRFRGRGFIQITGASNYSKCQEDIESAAKNLKASNRLLRVNAMTGIDWSRLNIMKEPEEVSRNRFVAAFCAASYWTRAVAKNELTWVDSAATFKRIVGSINTQADKKAAERMPGFIRWCSVIKCSENWPKSLNFDRGFDVLIGRPSSHPVS
jgi:predicted chitinase